MVDKARSLRNRVPGAPRTGCLLCRRLGKKCGEEKPNCKNCSQMKLQCTFAESKAVKPPGPVNSRTEAHNDGLVLAPCGAQQSSHSTPSANETAQPNSVMDTCLVAHNIPTTAPTVMRSFLAGHDDAADLNIPAEALPIDPELFANSKTQDTQNPQTQVPTFRAPVPEMETNSQVTFEDRICRLERLRCSLACSKFNDFSPDRVDRHSLETHINLFRQIVQHHEPVFLEPEEGYEPTSLGHVGKGVTVGRPFTCAYGHNMFIGDNVNIGVNCTFDDVGKVQIGNNCFIGPNVTILTESVDVLEGSRRAFRVTIEQRCWIDGGATILPGCTIGEESVVGAGAVVTEDVASRTVVFGNPARVRRRL